MKKCLDGRKVRNNKLFKVAHRRMTAAGYHRSVDQLKFRWKLLKSAYYKCKRGPDSPAQIKIQGWWRYEKTMIAIMESRHALVGAGINSDRHDEVTEDSDCDASMLQWPQPCQQPCPRPCQQPCLQPCPRPCQQPCLDNTTQNLDLIVGVTRGCRRQIINVISCVVFMSSWITVHIPFGLFSSFLPLYIVHMIVYL